MTRHCCSIGLFFRAFCASLWHCYHTGLLLASTMTTKIFVADDVSESGLGPLRSSGFIVEKRPGLAPPELREALKDCEGLIVRSETKVTADLMDGANSLRVIGRAGVGVDNIDVAAATIRRLVVMNAPERNTIP